MSDIRVSKSKTITLSSPLVDVEKLVELLTRETAEFVHPQIRIHEVAGDRPYESSYVTLTVTERNPSTSEAS